MATGTQPAAKRKASAEPPRDVFIHRQLNQARRKVRLIELGTTLLGLFVGVLLYLLLLAVVDHWLLPLGAVGRWLALLTLLACAGAYVVRFVVPLLLHAIHPLYAARTIERSTPALKNSLLNFLFFRGQPATVAPAVYETLERSAADDLSKVSIDNSIDRTNLLRVLYVLAAVLAICALYKVASPKDPFQTVSRVLLPWSNVAPPTRVEIIEVQPGNKTATFGETVRITAMVRGVGSTDRVLLIYSTADQQIVDREIEMQAADDGLHFEADLPPGDEGLQQDLGYRVQAGDALSPIYRLELTAQPMMFVQRLEYKFPEYTQRRPQVVEGQGDIEAIEGTVVTLTARANKPIQSAYLEWDPDLSGAADSAAQPPLATMPLEFRDKEAFGSFTLALNPDRKSPVHGSYQLRFITSDGLRNDAPVPHRITVIPDIAPVVDILVPKVKQIEVPENGRQTLEIRAVDPDFGLTAVELKGNTSRGQEWQHVLLEDTAGWKGQFIGKHVVIPAQLELRSGDVLTYRAVARDNRRDTQNALAPNEELTAEYQIVITPPEERPQQPPDAQQNNDQQPENQPAADPQQNPQDQPRQNPDRPEENPQNQDPKNQNAQNQNPQNQNPQNQDPQKQQPQPSDNTDNNDNSKPNQNNQSPDNNQKPTENGQNEKPSPMPGENPPDEQAGGQGGGQGDKSQQPSDAQPGTPEAGSGNAGDNAGADNQNPQQQPGGAGQPGDNQQPSRGSGQPGGEQTGERSSDDLHDGEAFDIIKRHVDQLRKQQQESAGDNTPREPQPGAQQDDNQPQDRDAGTGSDNQQNPDRDPMNQQRPAGSAADGQRPKDPAAQQPMPGAEGNQDTQQPRAADGNATTPAQNQQPRPGGQEAGEPKDAAGQQGEKPEPGAAQEDTQQPTKPMPGDAPSSPSPSQRQPSDAGAGVDNDSDKGPGQSPEVNRDRPKSQDPASTQPKPSTDPPGVSRSRNQSDSQGDTSGDRSGGGGQGSGQNAKLPGNDNAGSQQAGDEGSEAAPESGAGDSSDRPGDQQTAPKPTGNPDNQNQKGNGSRESRGNNEPGGPQNQQPPDGSQPDGDSQSQPGDPNNRDADRDPQQNSQTGPNQNPNQNPARRNQNDGSNAGGLPQGGGGIEGDARPAGVPPEGTPINQGEPNLEYTRKATDLVLDYLKDQKQKPDPSLLNKLGWTAEELQEFTSRWESLKREADADPQSRRTLDETLRSLGMRPVEDKIRSGETVDDQQRGNTEAFRSSPPAKYLRQYNASRKGIARSPDDEQP